MTKEGKLKIEKWDLLLILATILAPINTLRIWKIGPSEIICLIWMLKYLPNTFNRNNILSSFWATFFPILLLGTIFGIINYPEELILSDLVTYIYFALLSVTIYEHFKNTTSSIKLLEAIAISVSISYATLYLYSKLFSKTLLGIPLWYEGVRFSGGANNPHLLAILLGCVACINLYFLISRRSNNYHKLAHLISFLVALALGIATRSSTLILSLAITFLIFIYLLIIKMGTSKKKKICMIGLLFCATIITALLFENQIANYLMQWINSDVNGMGRIEIFQSITTVLEKNFLIGLGPGTHGLNGTIELHNTYLEILAMSGILGFMIFSSFSLRIIKELKKEPMFLLPICELYFYGLAGFSFRRLIFWIIIPIIISINNSMREIKNEKK